MPGPDPRKPQKFPLAAVAVALVGVAIGAQFITRSGSETPASGNFSWPTLRMPAPSPVGRAAPSTSLIQDSSDFDKLMDLFKQEKANPAAQNFAKEFAEEPELKKAWDDYVLDQKGGAPKETLQKLGQTLAGNSEFRQLVARYAQDPGFREAALKLAQMPEVKQVIRDTLAQAAAGGRSANSSSAGGATVAAIRATNSKQGFAGRLPEGALRGGGTFSASNGTMQAQAVPASAGMTASALATGPGAAGSGAQNTAGGPSNAKDTSNTPGPKPPDPQGDSGGYNVDPKLADSADAESDPAKKFLEEFPWLVGLTAAERRLIEAGVAQGYGVWGSCFKAKIFNRCSQACLASPASADSCKNAWESCQEWQEEIAGKSPAQWEVACIKECYASRADGCEVPEDIQCKYCNPAERKLKGQPNPACRAWQPPLVCAASKIPAALKTKCSDKKAWAGGAKHLAKVIKYAEDKIREVGQIAALAPIQVMNGTDKCLSWRTTSDRLRTGACNYYRSIGRKIPDCKKAPTEAYFKLLKCVKRKGCNSAACVKKTAPKCGT